MSKRRVLAGISGLIAAIGLVPSSASAAGSLQDHRLQRSGGSLVLVGGGLSEDNAAIYGDIIRLAGGAGRARIGIVTAASSVPADDPDAGTPDCNNSVCNGEYYVDLFTRYGAHAEWIPIDLDHIAASADPAVVTQVNGLTGFFFGGGDQLRYVTTMKRANGSDSAVLAAIRTKLRAGAVVAGTSAGAQIQAGADMLTGGDSYEALRDGSAPGYFDDTSALGYLPGGGFGFFDAGLLDTHFSSRGRLGRSVRLASDTQHRRVFGLDQDTALEVTDVGTRHQAMRVLGSSGVNVLDLRGARAREKADSWSIRGVRWTRLTSGDSYDAARWRLATDKPRLPAAAGPCRVPESQDVFGEDVLPALALGLAQQRECPSTSGRSHESDPTFMVTLTRGETFTVFGSPYRATLAGIEVRIEPAA